MSDIFESEYKKLQNKTDIMITHIITSDSGNIANIAIKQFKDTLEKFLNSGGENVILVFSDVMSLSSTGIGHLINIADKFGKSGKIYFVGVPGKIFALFDMLGLIPIFEFFDTTEEATNHIIQKNE